MVKNQRKPQLTEWGIYANFHDQGFLWDFLKIVSMTDLHRHEQNATAENTTSRWVQVQNRSATPFDCKKNEKTERSFT